MIYINHTKEIQMDRPTAVTIGKFDGLHIGHQKIIKELVAASKEYGYASVVFTFDFSQLHLLRNAPNRQLMTIEEKRELLDQLGVDYLIEYPFDEETRDMEAEDFVKEILVDRLHANYIVAGDDVGFGKNRAGNKELLQKLAPIYGFTVHVDEKVQDSEGKVVSSTYVRQALEAGDLKKAEELLGRPCQIV